VRGSKCFATFDLSHGYWQLQLDESSQECQSFITPDGIFSPTRVLHGTRNAVCHMQSSLQGIFAPLRERLLAWLDDLLLHATHEEMLLTLLRDFFEICREFKLS
jgi:Reverse transcriptase (RNA-dependent DNA polymerase)